MCVYVHGNVHSVADTRCAAFDENIDQLLAF